MSTELLADDFSRPGGMGTPLGQPVIGTYEAVPNAQEMSLADGYMQAINASIRAVRSPTGSADHFISYRWVGGAITNYLMCRWTGSLAVGGAPASAYVLVMSSTGSPDLDYFDAAGANTRLISAGSWGPSVVGDEWLIAIKGSVISVFRNSVWMASHSHASLTVGTYVGIATPAPGIGSNPLITDRVRAGRIDLDPAVKFRPDVGWRMPWHIDGSTLTVPNLAVNDDAKTDLNDEDDTGIGQQTSASTLPVTVVFPEPRVLTSIFLALASASSATAGNVQWLGLDGVTWTAYSPAALTARGWPDEGSVGFAAAYTQPVADRWRNTIWGAPLGVGAVRGIRWITANQQINPRALHLYGYIPQNPGVHRLRLWHPYINSPLPGDYFDLDDIGRGTLRSREFRIKNQSTSLTANGISVDIQSPQYGTTLTDQFGIRKESDAPGWVPTGTLASLAPDAISERFTFRRITSNDQAYRIETPFIRMLTGSFS